MYIFEYIDVYIQVYKCIYIYKYIHTSRHRYIIDEYAPNCKHFLAPKMSS